MSEPEREVWEETWRQKGSSLVFPDGHVDLHVDGEPPQKIEPKLVLWCERRAKLASAAPDMAKLLLEMWKKRVRSMVREDPELEAVDRALMKAGVIEETVL